jgi:methyltransferase OMS1
MSSYCGYLVFSYKKTVAAGAKEAIPDDVSHRYDVIAPSFDESVDWTERLMGMNKLRKKMAQEASGDVCEVSIGTGRNLTFYDWNFPGFNGVGRPDAAGSGIKTGKVKSFTAVDKSAEMLEVAHDKFSKEYPGIIGVRWVIQDATQTLPLPPTSPNEKSGNKTRKKYDTIIQTMGLCSTNDPVRLLRNLGDCLEENGRILLLEHGKGTLDLVNNYLDGLAARHAREFGCVWNKDIGRIVEESGLDVVKMERKHFGTTWWIELRPKRRPVADSTESNVIDSQLATKTEVKRGKFSWFWSS